MSDRQHVPAILGGTPVRTWPFRRTPERSTDVREPYSELAFIRAWLERAPNWEGLCPVYGIEVGAGLAPEVAERARRAFSPAIAKSLGGEQAACSAEFAAIHAPDQDVIVVPGSNCTRMLTDTLAAASILNDVLGIRTPEPGDEMLVPALTWRATAGSVLRRNMVPVPVDIDPATLCMDIDAMRAAITERTVGVIPVHLYNQLAPVQDIMSIGGPLGWLVVEDMAHAAGALFDDGRAAGTVGHGGDASEEGSKVPTACEGGMMLTSNPTFAYQTASVVTVGRTVENSRTLQSDQDRMPAVAAALGRAQLRRFPKQRRSVLAVFEALDAIAEQLPGITPFRRRAQAPPSYKWIGRVDLAQLHPMTLDQLVATLSADLGCDVERTYQSLTREPKYDPHSDPALRISEDYWHRIDPGRYEAPNAEQAHAEVITVEFAAGLDPRFPEAFADSWSRAQLHRPRLAREVTVA